MTYVANNNYMNDYLNDIKNYQELFRNYWDENAISQIPPDVFVASKSGAVDKTRNEVLFVNGKIALSAVVYPNPRTLACFLHTHLCPNMLQASSKEAAYQCPRLCCSYLRQA